MRQPIIKIASIIHSKVERAAVDKLNWPEIFCYNPFETKINNQ